MDQIILISEKYLKSFSTFDLNIETKSINSTIAISQDLYLLPILGTDLFTEISNQYSGGSLTNVNSTLLNSYIQPCLAAYTVYQSVDYLLFKFTNKSIEKQKSDTSDPINLNELEHLKGKLLSTAQHYGEKLIRYLIGNSTVYPLYISGNNTVDKYQSATGNIQGGIYIPNRNHYYER